MKSKFEVEPEAHSPVLVDPEAYDASEQEFAVSLEHPAPKARFVVESEAESSPVIEQPAHVVNAESPLVLSAEPAEVEDRWRQELSAKLNHYRARRTTKEPRFPSLQLKFESDPPPLRHAPVEPPPQPILTQQVIPVETHAKKVRVENDSSARILEFPRLAMAPPRRVDELADPILDRPRILEVPDAPPPGPALGGILIGPEEKPEVKPSEFEVPLQAASLSHRGIATALDAIVIISCVVMFAAIFQSVTPTPLPLTQKLIASAALFGVFWSAYHFLALTYCGTTLGLRLSRLQLRSFDGKPVFRPTRRWRAITAAMSAACMGMGYAWCLLDEDQLCWHDRITRTYVSPS
ncbi:MAG TPA: RDD family protein [Terriglobales bacterium]|nr:RDD family protein [Terriglobales bacterium]